MTEKINIPRYTSYPTAPHFHEGIGASEYKAWLGELSDKQALSLYFHIPYCRQLCWFCGCHTKVVNKYESIKNYMGYLSMEVEIASRELPNSAVTHIHFGGGSPTVIEVDDFARFADLLKDKFIISDKAEIAVEMDPRTTDAKKIKAYAKSGVTRASIGVQDFDSKVQEAINRIQPYEMVLGVVEELYNNGIKDLNVDLVYGLPHQTIKTIDETINKALLLQPSRISLFGYAHVPWMKKHQNLLPEESLPNSKKRLEMFEFASSAIENAGYVAVGLDHFAKPDDSLVESLNNKTIKRNFQGYTIDDAEALVGFGVSSISSLPQGYAQNNPDIVGYVSSIKAGKLPIVRGIKLTDDDIERRDIIMSLMSNMEAYVPEGRYSQELTMLKKYIEEGDVTYEKGRIKVKEVARSRLRLIASIFDAYLHETEHRYSQAV